jgi:DNA replication factor GINS
MNLDELQSIRDRERQSDSLQQLREDFYVEVGEFVQDLRDEREAAAERADDPFDAPEVNRLTDDINTAEQTVEAIYERRVGKLVKMASFAAADMPTEDEGLTAEERQLFERMVAAIEDNRETVMHVIDGEDPTEASAGGSPAAPPSEPAPDQPPEPREPGERTPTSADEAEPVDGGVDAADLMAGSEESPAPAAPDPTPDADARSEGPAGDGESAGEQPTGPGPDTDEPVGKQAPPDASEPIPPDVREDGGAVGRDAGSQEATSTPEPTPGAVTEETANPQTAGGNDPAASTGSGGGTARSDRVDRETVRITADVGQIFGVDEREYELTQEDVVTLPAENAAPLVERDVAERLDRTGN